MSDVNLFLLLKYYSFWIDLNYLYIWLNVFIEKYSFERNSINHSFLFFGMGIANNIEIYTA